MGVLSLNLIRPLLLRRLGCDTFACYGQGRYTHVCVNLSAHFWRAGRGAMTIVGKSCTLSSSQDFAVTGTTYEIGGECPFLGEELHTRLPKKWREAASCLAWGPSAQKHKSRPWLFLPHPEHWVLMASGRSELRPLAPLLDITVLDFLVEEIF